MSRAFSESLYIGYRRIKAISIAALYYLFRFLPIDDKKVVLSSFEGKQGYSCNPKYIAEEILKRNKLSSQAYKLIWLVNDTSNIFPSEILVKKNSFWNRAYQLSTAAIWIDNHRKPLETRKRKKQLYIATWHGAIGFKAVGELRGTSFPEIARLVSKHDSQLVDYFLSNSSWCSDMYRKAFFYEGEIIKTGSPRCDVYREAEHMRNRIRKEFELPENSKILLYAPTFRSGTQNIVMNTLSGESRLSYEALHEVLNKKFQGDWYIFVRLHPSLKGQKFENKENNSIIFDITNRDDAYDVLAATDLFISDYSSIAFDAAAMNIPVFIFAEDMDDYVKDRGRLLWDMEDLPFKVSYSNDELLKNIIEFNEEEYHNGLGKLREEVELLEDGYASQRVVDLIQKK
ncbi:CDP-glycerol glycerophosphotransferase family protein [Paenibacillus sp. Y5S-9]|uniref:CDP-glycerol glycerophosphotransferase family protein n=1 Tax=Paenibacillus sp. Y5S-9 TaxID=3122489 RepID=UPI0030D6179E